ncbi:MAG: site-specific integrase [Gordonia sp. (in: high G+C Gram-positive bacteria)]|nr:MAG: site-specific integrase [Gordonia sp. (in: high G+C Gram-positive bacteria)]
MASIQKRVLSNGAESWRVLWRQDGKQRNLTFVEPAGAHRFKDHLERFGVAEAMRLVDIEEGGRQEVTLADWCTAHCDALTGVEDETIKKYRSYIRNDLADIGVLPLSSVTDVTIGRWIKEMHAAGASAKTIKNKHGFLAGALNRAVAAGRIDRNPCGSTRLYRSDSDEMVFLERDEFDLIHFHMTDRWKPLFLWLVSTGMRFSEATAITVGDVHQGEATARINKAWKYSTDGRKLGLTKSRKGQRTINLPPQVFEVIDLSRDRATLLFDTQTGGSITAQLARNKGWLPARTKATAAGLTKEPRIHDLRHTCASWMINAGVSLPVIQAHLGHESIQTTVDRYGHLDRNAGKTAAAAIAKMLG